MTRSTGSVRRAGAADLARCEALWREILRHHADLDPLFRVRPGAGEEIRRMLAGSLEDPDAALFVCEASGAVVGFCAVRIDRAPPILQETRRAEITDLCVEAAARRRGFGRALAEAALAFAASRGATRVEVRVAAGNREGQAFWRALSFGDLVDVLQRRL